MKIMNHPNTSSLGNSLRIQRDRLATFLSQWEAAINHSTSGEANEVLICGDMNLDALHDKWLSRSYHLYSLSSLVQDTCNVNDFTQLVKSTTRAQFNSVKGITALSCIDHVYVNCKWRCSDVDQLPISVGPGFGDSVTRLLGGPGTHSGMSASCSEFELAAINTQFKTNYQNIWNNSDSEVKIFTDAYDK